MTLIVFILLSEQDRGRPGARGHHVGDPCSNLLRWALKREKAVSGTVDFENLSR